MKKFLQKLLGRNGVRELSESEEKQRELNQSVREQLLSLKKKGLSIPVFTL